jgi:hypothetical protein
MSLANLLTVAFGKMPDLLGRRLYEEGCATRDATMRNQGVWERGGIEPSIDELLSDPIAVAVMRRDGLHPEDVNAAFQVCRRHHEARLLWPGLCNPPLLAHFVRVLARIGLDTEDAPLEPSIRNNLYAACVGCLNREPCLRWLMSEMTGEGYQGFCPSARTFDRLIRVSCWQAPRARP